MSIEIAEMTLEEIKKMVLVLGICFMIMMILLVIIGPIKEKHIF